MRQNFCGCRSDIDSFSWVSIALSRTIVIPGKPFETVGRQFGSSGAISVKVQGRSPI